MAADVGFAAEAVDSLDGVFEAAPPKLKLASFKFTLAPVKPVAPVLGDRLKSIQIFSSLKVFYNLETRSGLIQVFLPGTQWRFFGRGSWLRNSAGVFVVVSGG